ncbi:hypothetical protein SDC9_113975 [bioreactor metagenome]|uniref:Sulfur carrier protein ThiS n=1 Tax=bioreactor metagenome TaxID=1076179 RepID=A0A645BNL8_9ZZZZ
MEILWNGVPREISGGITVAEFLAACGMKPEAVVVELNDEITGAEELCRRLNAGDRLNAFRIVAGG